MKLFNNIPIWENKRRLKLLKEFRGLILTYFDNSHYSSMAEGRIEEDVARQAREQINRSLNLVYPVVISAGVSPAITWKAPANAGGFVVESLDILVNVLNLGHYQLSYNVAIDHIDRAIGAYEADQSKSWVRTFNPFWWVNQLLISIARLPFKFLGEIGFDAEKAEKAPLGKLLKGILYMLTGAASFLTILHLMGWLETFKGF